MLKKKIYVDLVTCTSFVDSRQIECVWCLSHSKYDINTCNYIRSFFFLKMLPVSMLFSVFVLYKFGV